MNVFACKMKGGQKAAHGKKGVMRACHGVCGAAEEAVGQPRVVAVVAQRCKKEKE
jgi:hypothetical protein